MGAGQNDILDLKYFENFVTNILEGYDYGGGEPLFLIWTNLERFATYNEQQGIIKGDELLECFGDILQARFMDGVVGRIEGVHFAILTASSDVEHRLLMVHDILREYDFSPTVDFKAGIVEISKPGETLDRLIEKARAACRLVTGKSGNYIGYYTSDMDRGILLEDYVPRKLKDAMEDHSIYVIYQPIVRTVTGKICGMEALARWDDPVFGSISPAEFVPILEKRHMVHMLDDWIVRLVAEDYGKARKSGERLCPASINLSRYDFEDGDILDTFLEVTESYHIPRGWFRIEITESALLVQQDLLRNGISRFREYGFEIWMDNFGAGYASLNALEEFDFDVVKLDIHFLQDFRGEERSEQAKILLSGLVNMLKQLKLHTLVMGVETEAEWDYLHTIGCEMLQGYYIGKPQICEEILSKKGEIEDFRENKYYEVLGAIEIDNYLPGEDSDDTDSANTGSLSITKKHSTRQVEPMAVVEYLDRRYTFLFYNASFLRYLKELGLGEVEEAESLLNRPSGVMQQHLRRFAERVMRLESDMHFSVVIRGKLIDMWADFLAVNQETGAIAFIVYNSLLTERGKARNQDFEDSMRMYYNVFDRMDLIRRKDGMILRSYLNTAEYGGLNEGQFFESVMERFAGNYIEESDVKRFKEFLNFDTLDQRSRSQLNGLVTGIFPTRMDSGEIRKKRYSLLPMLLHGQQFVLFTLIDVGKD